MTSNYISPRDPSTFSGTVMCSALLCRCQVTSGPVVPNRFGTRTDPQLCQRNSRVPNQIRRNVQRHRDGDGGQEPFGDFFSRTQAEAKNQATLSGLAMPGRLHVCAGRRSQRFDSNYISSDRLQPKSDGLQPNKGLIPMH